MNAKTVARFLKAASTPRPYRFLDTLIRSEDTPSLCRKHNVHKVPHMFGEQLLVCPRCFPQETV